MIGPSLPRALRANLKRISPMRLANSSGTGAKARESDATRRLVDAIALEAWRLYASNGRLDRAGFEQYLHQIVEQAQADVLATRRDPSASIDWMCPPDHRGLGEQPVGGRARGEARPPTRPAARPTARQNDRRIDRGTI